MSDDHRTPGSDERSESILRLVTSATETADPAADEPTVSAQEMVSLTGVGRERLRTWERRHGFPKPLRQRNNVRRYRAQDVAIVTTVQQLVNAGTPVGEAIESARSGANELTVRSLGALDGLALPAVGIAPGKPLAVEWVNAASLAAGMTPVAPGRHASAEAFLGERAAERVRELLTSEEAGATVISHGSWLGNAAAPHVRSLAWRATSEDPSTLPMVVLIELPASVPAEHDHARGDDQQRQATLFATAVSRARRATRTTHGLLGIQHALRELIVNLHAVDGFFLVRSGTNLRTATSVRGSIGARSVPLGDAADVLTALDDVEVDWLGPETLRAFDLNPNLATLIVPLNDGTFRDGAVVLTFKSEFALGDVARELLHGFGVSAAFSAHDHAGA